MTWPPGYRTPPAHRHRRRFPDRQVVLRLVVALLAEQADEWPIARRHVSVESLEVPRTDTPAENDPRPAIDATAD